MKLLHKSTKVLSGGKLCGGNPESGHRVEHDFYATNPLALNMLLDSYPIKGKCLEPCVGQGHLANVIKNRVDRNVTCLDIVNRGYPNTIVKDFMSYYPKEKYSCIITNPPFSLAEEFIRKSFSLLEDGGTCAMFLKVQFLEGDKREQLFKEYPPKYIYVFRKRMATWNNGNSTDCNGKKWATTFCHAWFIFVKGSTSEPIVRWL
jgi:hypothetical protein